MLLGASLTSSWLGFARDLESAGLRLSRRCSALTSPSPSPALRLRSRQDSEDKGASPASRRAGPRGAACPSPSAHAGVCGAFPGPVFRSGSPLARGLHVRSSRFSLVNLPPGSASCFPVLGADVSCPPVRALAPARTCWHLLAPAHVCPPERFPGPLCGFADDSTPLASRGGRVSS